MKISGYGRPDGSVGVRNLTVVMAAADCSEPVARAIAQKVDGAVAVTQHYGCIPGEMVANTLIGVGKNPNVAAVLVVGMGCEGMPAQALAKMIKSSGKPVECISIQELGGTRKALFEGEKILKALNQKVQTQKRSEFGLDKLIIGVKCGGSDTTSGLAGNPSVGLASDMLVDAGGSTIMSEPIEAVGAEESLSKKAINAEVKLQILKMIADEEKRWKVPGAQMEFMCRGNVEGGLTTIEEKSLGAVHKIGSRPIMGVLKTAGSHLEKVPTGINGCYLQDSTHMEPMAMSIMAAAGAQIVIFISGCGGTFGHAIVPFIKVTGNPEIYDRMPDDMDINAGTVITGEESVDSVGQRIFKEIVAVASGKQTLGESLGYNNFSVYRRDPRMEALLNISA